MRLVLTLFLPQPPLAAFVLVNRRLYYIPFSRTTNLDDKSIEQIENILKECIANGGVLIAQPEHILSFKLKTIGCQLPDGEKFSMRSAMARLHALLNKTSRVVLDESDEILHVRYQLVYTWGACEPLDGYPHRWTITQELLNLVATHLSDLQDSKFPFVFALQGHSSAEHRPSSFPALKLVEGSDAAAKELINKLVDDIMEGRVSAFDPQHLTLSDRTLIQRFLSTPLEDEALRAE